MPLLLPLALVLIAAGAGMASLRRLRCLPEGPTAAFVWGAALGLGMMAYGVQALGLLGWLRPPILLGWAGLLFIAGLPALWWWARSLPWSARSWRESVSWRIAGWDGVATVALLAACLGIALLTLPGALAPLSPMDWDSLSYHLAAPKIYLRRGAIGLIPYDSHTSFPFTMEMLYTLALQWGGAGAAKVVHWSAGWLTALALGAWVGERAGDATGRSRPWAGPLAMALFASIPLAMWEATTAYIDLGTALFQFLALDGLFRAYAAPERRTALRWAGLAGVCSGLAMGTKYTALLQFGLLGLGTIGLALAGAGPGWGGALAFGLMGGLVAAPWYVRNWLWTHNPVYPFFVSRFPKTLYWTRAMEQAYQGEQRSFGLGKGVGDFLRALWNLALHGRAFFIVNRTVVGDFLGSLGAGVAGLAPWVVLTRGVRREVWWLLAYCGGSLGIWFFLSQQSRYLLPIYAAGSAAAALIVIALPNVWLRRAAGLFVALTILLQATMHWPVARPSWLWATGILTGDEYRQAIQGDLGEAARFVNSLPPGTRLGMYQETRGFWFDVPYFWANPGQHNLIDYDALHGDGRRLAKLLGAKFRLTHVLINWQFWDDSDRTSWGRAVRDAVRRGAFREVFRSRGNPGAPVSVYQLQ